jgi:hypothetical protein
MNGTDKAGYAYPACDGWHDWECGNTQCPDHPEFKLFKGMDENEAK